MAKSLIPLDVGTGGPDLASDLISSVEHQTVKLQFGDPTEAINVSMTNPLPVANLLLEIAKGNIAGHSIVDVFGRNPDIGTATDPEDVWGGGGDYTGFPTGSAETMEIASSSANDTSAGTGARTVRVSGLIDGSGAAVADQDVTLNGTSQVSLGAGTYIRASKIVVLTAGSGGENAGTLTLRHTTTTANIFAVMPVSANHTHIAVYTVPLATTLYLFALSMDMARASGAAGSASVSLRIRPNGGVFQSELTPEITNSKSFNESNFPHVIEALSDVKIRVDSVSDNATIVSAHFDGILVDD